MTRPAPAWWAVNEARDPAWSCRPAPTAAVRDFHRSLPGYATTRLAPLPGLARAVGVARMFAKDESNRLGLPAFKALGASWAIHRALRDRAPAGPVTVVTATDGNHGRAVARFARQFGHRAAIFVPDGVHPAAVQAIRDEGADVTHVPGDYDAAVHAAASATGPDMVLIQDMAWDGYEQVPGWIVDGYTTLFAEIDEQLHEHGIARPDVLVVPAGVGSLLQAALTHYRGGDVRPGPAVLSVEPGSAACVLASVAAGHPVTVATGVTSMAGLNCGTVSSLAWPLISRGLDACVAVGEAAAADAARELAGHGVDAGPCGAASLAALRAVRDGTDADRLRAALGLTAAGTVVLLVTEGTAANPGLPPNG
ncbi:pyridoxal-phosphate dependent enzyme [Dactylosporangium sp. NPDC049525]|uniref:pyridoxal-phosphate dependent enzyme n=1 Tax=Dactylosporangium sp. NPDC049525 TaxID=3154730 RepID=UPI00343104F3